MAPNEQAGGQDDNIPSNSLFSNAEQNQLNSFLSGLDNQVHSNQGLAPMPHATPEPLSSSQYIADPVTSDMQTPLPPSIRTHRRLSKPLQKHRSTGSARPYSLSPPLSPTSSASSSGEDARSKKTTRAKGSGSSSSRGRKPPQELLTEAQKKANHIASEQKRRANIRVGFEQLVAIVPALSHASRSEALILQKSYEYIRQLVDTKTELKNQVQHLQIILGDEHDGDSSEGETGFSY